MGTKSFVPLLTEGKLVHVKTLTTSEEKEKGKNEKRKGCEYERNQVSRFYQTS